MLVDDVAAVTDTENSDGQKTMTKAQLAKFLTEEQQVDGKAAGRLLAVHEPGRALSHLPSAPVYPSAVYSLTLTVSSEASHDHMSLAGFTNLLLSSGTMTP